MSTSINIVILGNLQTGKSTICSQLLGVEKETQPTAGVEETKLTRNYNEQSVSIRLIDTSGDPHFMDLIEPELLHADAVLFVFAFNDQQSYDDLNYWIELAEPFVDDYTTLMIVGNKSEDKNINQQNPEQFAKKNDMLFIETSAQYKIGLEEMIKQVVESVLEKRKKRLARKELKIQSSVMLELRESKETRKITTGIIGDPSLGNFRVFSKACKLYNAKDTTVSLFQSSLSQKSELFFPEQHVIIQLLDITDNELARLLTNPNFQSPEVLVLVFSTESLKSFQNLETYINMFEEKVKVVIVGTKADSLKREVTHQMIVKYSKSQSFKFFQISDKGTLGIEQLFEQILRTNREANAKQSSFITVESKETENKENNKKDDRNDDKKDDKKNENTENNKQNKSSSSLKYLIGLGIVGVLGALAFVKYRK